MFRKKTPKLVVDFLFVRDPNNAADFIPASQANLSEQDIKEEMQKRRSIVKENKELLKKNKPLKPIQTQDSKYFIPDPSKEEFGSKALAAMLKDIEYNEYTNSIKFKQEALHTQYKTPLTSRNSFIDPLTGKETTGFKSHAVQTLNTFVDALSANLNTAKQQADQADQADRDSVLGKLAKFQSQSTLDHIKDSGLLDKEAFNLLYKLYKDPVAPEIRAGFKNEDEQRYQKLIFDLIHEFGLAHTPQNSTPSLSNPGVQPPPLPSTPPPPAPIDGPPPLPSTPPPQVPMDEQLPLMHKTNGGAPVPPPPPPLYVPPKSKIIKRSPGSSTPTGASVNFMAELRAKLANSEKSASATASAGVSHSAPISPVIARPQQDTAHTRSFNIGGTSRLGAANDKIKDLEKQLKALEKEKRNLKEESDKVNEKLVNEKKELTEQLNAHKNKLHSLTEQYLADKKVIEDDKQALANQHLFLQEEYIKCNSEIDKLKLQIEIKEAAIAALELEKQTVKAEVTNLKDQLAQVDEQILTFFKDDDASKRLLARIHNLPQRNNEAFAASLLNHLSLVITLGAEEKSRQVAAMNQLLDTWTNADKDQEAKKLALQDFEKTATTSFLKQTLGSVAARIIKSIAIVLIAGASTIIGAAIGVGVGAVAGALAGNAPGAVTGALLGLAKGSVTGLGLGLAAAATVTGVSTASISGFLMFKPNQVDQSLNEIDKTGKLTLAG